MLEIQEIQQFLWYLAYPHKFVVRGLVGIFRLCVKAAWAILGPAANYLPLGMSN